MSVIQAFNRREDVIESFIGTRFGEGVSPYEVVIDTLEKIKQDYSTGKTAIACTSELGYIRRVNVREYRVTERGSYLLQVHEVMEQSRRDLEAILRIVNDPNNLVDRIGEHRKTLLRHRLMEYAGIALQTYPTHSRPVGDAIQTTLGVYQPTLTTSKILCAFNMVSGDTFDIGIVGVSNMIQLGNYLLEECRIKV